MNNIQIMIHGPIGSGKSTIAAKIMRVLITEGFSVDYVGMEDILKKEDNCRNIANSTHVTIYEKQEPRTR